jgi:hypothetical protein
LESQDLKSGRVKIQENPFFSDETTKAQRIKEHGHYPTVVYEELSWDYLKVFRA